MNLDTDPTDAAENRKSYRQEAVDRMIDKAKEIDRAIVLRGAHVGLRVSEIVALEWSDVDLGAEQVTVQNRCSNKRRVAVSRGAGSCGCTPILGVACSGSIA